MMIKVQISDDNRTRLEQIIRDAYFVMSHGSGFCK